MSFSLEQSTGRRSVVAFLTKFPLFNLHLGNTLGPPTADTESPFATSLFFKRKEINDV